MKLPWAIALTLMVTTASLAAPWSPSAYYGLNPHDDFVVGATLSSRGETTLTEASLGYSWGQKDPRGRLRYMQDRGLGSRVGYDIQLYHEVQARSDLVPLFQTGYYEGHTGVGLTAFHRMGRGKLGTFSLIGENVWSLQERGTLRAVPGDRLYAARLGYIQDTRDDRANPRSGGRLEVTALQAVGVLDGTRSYSSARAEWSRFEPVGLESALGWRVHGAMTSMSVPTQRALWLPGQGVRGYDFVTDRGNVAAVANLELRVPLHPLRDVQVRRLGTLRQVQLAAFADLGTVHKSAPGWVLRGGLGVGLRVPVVAFGTTPMVLRLDAAQGLTRGGKLNSYVLLAAPELF